MIRLRPAVPDGPMKRKSGWRSSAWLAGSLSLGVAFTGCAGAVGEDWQGESDDGTESHDDTGADEPDDQNDDSAAPDESSDETQTAVSPSTSGTGGGGETNTAPTSASDDTSDTAEPDVSSGSGTTPEAAIVPTRIRRLSNVEYANSVRALLGTTELYEDGLPADVRQRNFTVNQAQTVSSDWNAEVERLAKTAAAALVTSNGLDRLSPCAGQTTDACAEQFIDAIGAKAFRRAVTSEEHADLATIYQRGAAEAGFNRGMELVIAAILQAPSFIYITELGTAGQATTTLTGEEVATLLAYVTTQTPPDDTLLEAGRQGALADPAERAQQARRLLSTEAGKKTLETMAPEWFTADWVLTQARDNIPEFNERRTQLLDESRNLHSHGDRFTRCRCAHVAYRRLHRRVARRWRNTTDYPVPGRSR